MGILEELGLPARSPGACSGPGRWSPRGGETLGSVSPADGEPIAEVWPAGDVEYEAVLRAAVEAARAWREVPAPERGRLVRRIGELLRGHKDALGSLVSREMGKIKAEGDGEVQEMIDMADLAVGQSRMLYGHTLHSERRHHRMYEQWHPLGVVGVITAFNFPVAVWAWNAFLAAVSGNTVVWRPSPQTPLCAVAVQVICNRALREVGHAGVFHLLIERGVALAQRLVADPRVALVSFTGSSAVGAQVAQAVAARMGRSVLECSGNNAVIVDRSADLDLAARAVLFGAVGTAGQRCTTTRRLIVQREVYPELRERLVAAYRQVRIGDPLDPEVLMGPLIDAPAVEAYRAALRELAGHGAEPLYGGRVLERPGYFVEPTLVLSRPEWPIVRREVFAPILHIMPYTDLDEALTIHNEVPQGLSSALFTRDLASAERFLSAAGSDCGIANINLGTSGAEIGAAFGGEKATGGGREAGSDAWKAYMRRQTTTINWGTGLPLAQGVRFGS